MPFGNFTAARLDARHAPGYVSAERS